MATTKDCAFAGSAFQEGRQAMVSMPFADGIVAVGVHALAVERAL